MKNKQTQSTGLSSCCKAEMRVVGGVPDFVGDTVKTKVTMHYECTVCSKPCDMWSSIPQKTNNPMEDWKDELETRLYYVSLPKKYWPGLVSFFSEKISHQKQDLKKKIEGWALNSDHPKTFTGEHGSKMDVSHFGLILYSDLKEFLKTL